jgi:hypothetical protein
MIALWDPRQIHDELGLPFMADAWEKSLWDGIFPYKNEPFTLWTFFTIKDNSGLKL